MPIPQPGQEPEAKAARPGFVIGSKCHSRRRAAGNDFEVVGEQVSQMPDVDGIARKWLQPGLKHLRRSPGIVSQFAGGLDIVFRL